MTPKLDLLNPISDVINDLHKKGHPDSTCYSILNLLKHIDRYSDIHNPDQIKEFIANKKCSDNYKQKLVFAYDTFANFYKIKWERPTYKPIDKMPKLPTEKQLLTFITAAGAILSLKLWISYKTGFRPIEVHRIQVRDVDIPHNAINAQTAKDGCARIIKIPEQLTHAIVRHINKCNLQPNDKLFRNNPKHYGASFRYLRRRLSKKMNDPSLMTIRLYDFRHYFATMQYIKYRDVPLTALDMGHKDWNTTSKYIHLARILELVDADENYIVKTAETIEQAKELLENGFIFVQEFKGISIYRKRK